MGQDDFAAREYIAYSVPQHDERPTRGYLKIGCWVEEELGRNYHQLPLFIPVLLGVGVIIWYWAGSYALWPLLAIAGLVVAVAQGVGQFSLLRRTLIWAAALLLLGFVLISWRVDRLNNDRLDHPWFGRFYAHIERVETKASLGKEYLYLNTQNRQNLPTRVRVSRPLEAGRVALSVGDMIIVRARLMPPTSPAVPGGYDFAERAFFQGLGATGSAIGPIRLLQSNQNWASSQVLQRPLSAFIHNRIGGDAGAIAATLASGDRGGISAIADEWMRNSGMAHLLSISGLHVTALVGGIYILMSRILGLFPIVALRSNIPLISAIAGAMGAVFYTWLTGAEVPTIRSCVAAILVLIALGIGRDPLSMRLLAIGATVVILLWPEAVLGPSFQLSFAAVAAIIALHELPRMRRLREVSSKSGAVRKLLYASLSLLLTGIVVEVTLAPIALYHFQQTGVYGALANMIAIPLTTFVIMPLLGLCLLLDWTGLAGPLWSVAEWTLIFLLNIAEIAATAPGAKITLPAFAPWNYGLFAGGLCLLYLLSSRLRWLGIIPMVIGMAAMARADAADVLIDSSGRHLALLDQSKRAYFLHEGSGQFVQDIMREQLGVQTEFTAVEDYPNAKCNAHICILIIHAGTPHEWRAMITRSNQYLDYPMLIEACRSVEIAISDRTLPKDCRPLWLKADRKYLRQSGGIAVYTDPKIIRSVAETHRHKPWSEFYEGGGSTDEAYTRSQSPKESSSK